MKLKLTYVCTECGAVHKKWAGRCPDCGAWNSMAEDVISEGMTTHFSATNKTDAAQLGKEIKFETLDGEIKEFPRKDVGIAEFDRVLGGGLVKGSAVLIGGDPGIGKSTLLLQTVCSLSQKNIETIYISGEESVNQIRMRAKRLGLGNIPAKLAAATSATDIVKTMNDSNPDVIVIDSIQTIFMPGISSAPGTVSQVRTCANEIISIAKKKNIVVMIVSHVTKEGQIAGPKVLEHMVDAVLYFEGDRNHQFRILRSIKNRFGAANEIGVFEMHDSGLREVSNPSELFLSSRTRNISGTTVFAGMEGTRPILIEVQALVAPSFMPSPRRAATGWDSSRLAMIIAVLGTRMGVRLADKEVYLNIAGGLKINEPAVDLAVVTSLISAIKDRPLPENCVVMGEVGLSGEVRMVSQIEARMKEAQKLGFEVAIVPEAINGLKSFKRSNYAGLKIETIKHIRDLVRFFK